MTTKTETCQVRVHVDWSSHPCGRPVKENGKCGVHARVDRKRDESRVQAEAYRDEAKARVQVSQPLKAALDTLDIPYYVSGEESYGSDPRGHEVRIDAQYFERLTIILQSYIVHEE